MNNDTQTQALALGQQPQIGGSGIDMDALMDEWRLSKSYVEQYTRDFIQLDNLVDGVAMGSDPDVPFVGDTTLAGLVRSIPRNSLQQLPVFSAIVNGTKNSIPALVCTYLLKRTAFNEDTFGKGLLSTLQIGAEQALTHGYAPFMVATGSMYNDFGTTMRLLHFSDTAPEPGITDSNESGYHYVVANLTASRVRRIRDAATKNPNTSWMVDQLNLVLEASPRAKDYSIYESAARRNNAGEAAGPTYEFVTRYETGPDSTIVTFCPEATEQPLRVLDSKSKWGYPRVMYLVIDPAALTPFGVSRVRLASPNQNLMNIYYGQIAAMLLLNSKPPILKRGRFLKPVELKRGAIWETLDQNAQADLKNMDNGALEHFVETQQQFATQIQNIMSSTISALNNSEAAGFSKTGPGVKQQNEAQDVSTNQITKILENFLRQYALVALDTLFAEQSGVERIIVDDDTKNAINALRPDTIGDDNKIEMDWERFYEAIEEWSVDIEVSVSKDQMEEKKRGDLQDMLTVLAQTADGNPDAMQKVAEITDMLMQDMAPLAAATPAAALAPGASVGQPAQPTPPTPAAGQVAAPGGQVHETGDLVKLFSAVTDPRVKNAILTLLQLPPETTAPTLPATAPAAPTAPITQNPNPRPQTALTQ